MLKRVREWFARGRQWRRENDAAWAAVNPAALDGLNSFQVSVERASLEELKKLGRSLVDRRVDRDREGSPTISARLEGSDITIWLGVDEAQIGGAGIDVRLERWAGRTPADLEAEFLTALRKIAQGDPSAVA